MKLIGPTALSDIASLSATILPSDVPLEALKRFAAKIEVDHVHGHEGTACVLWTGAKTCGQGKSIKYGALKYQGQRWYAHRWAAHFIHRQEIAGFQVDHKCCRPLCVQHLQAISPEWNRELQWIRVQVGLEENPRRQFEEDDNGIPFWEAPAWYNALKALLPQPERSEDCPF